MAAVDQAGSQQSKKREFEQEQYLLLQVPDSEAVIIDKLLQNSRDVASTSATEILKLQFKPDMRHGVVHIGDKQHSASLVDLPCVVELQKTLDKKNFYKAGDVAQMLVCHKQSEDHFGRKSHTTSAVEHVDRNYVLNKGLTPPLKNVRKKRFRKTLKKKYMDAPDIEKELKRLLRADLESKALSWKLVDPEESENYRDTDLEEGPGSSRLDEHALFGEALSSTSGEDEENEEDKRTLDDDDEKPEETQ